LAFRQFRIHSYFKQKQHINGQRPAEQACKVWSKNFQALLSNHILGVGSFFKPHPVDLAELAELARTVLECDQRANDKAIPVW